MTEKGIKSITLIHKKKWNKITRLANKLSNLSYFYVRRKRIKWPMHSNGCKGLGSGWAAVFISFFYKWIKMWIDIVCSCIMNVNISRDKLLHRWIWFIVSVSFSNLWMSINFCWLSIFLSSQLHYDTVLTTVSARKS